MSFLSNLFGGGSRNRESTRDEKSVQSDINRALKDSGGQWTSQLNDLVAERDRARSGATSQGLGSFGNAIRSIPSNIARDVRMGTSAGLFSNRDKQAENLAKSGFSQREIGDFFSRTDATRARSEAEMAQRRDSGPSAEERAQAAAQRAQQAQQQAPMMQSPIYRNPFGQAGTTVMPQPGRPGGVSPDMQREALRIFESQRGAGQVPYQMLPFQQGLGSMRRQPRFMPQTAQRQDPFAAARSMGMQVGPTPGQRQSPFSGMSIPQLQQMNELIRQQNMMRQPAVMPRMPSLPDTRMGMPPPPMRQNPNVSPAFQFAAQNYNRLGGMQRTMDRPMDMMSVAERQRVNDMARGMSSMQRPTAFSGKGGGQRPTMSPGKGGGAMLPQAFGGGIPAMGIASLLGRGRFS